MTERSSDWQTAKVLLVEDEESFIESLMVGLPREGFEVKVARDGAEALAIFDGLEPDVVLLDVVLSGMPGVSAMSGIDVCRELRLRSDVPIILVNAKSSEIDTVVGLEMGADDYIAKPYRMRELVARIRAVLRRGAVTNAASSQRKASEIVTVGDVVIDHERHEVIIRGSRVSVPLKEFELLSQLLDNAGRVLTRERLMHRIWGADYVGDTKTLDVHIKRLRAKIEEDPSDPKRIVTIRGLGYKYLPPSS